VHGFADAPVFAATPRSLAVVADPPQHATDPIHWSLVEG
jgi:hypothetical protein